MSGYVIIGVDPGKAVGLAVLWADDTFTAEELSYRDAEDRIHQLTYGQRRVPMFLSVERFTITQRTLKMTRQYDALYLIGVCRFLARTRNVTFLLESVTDATKTGNHDVLRAFGWWQRGVRDHVHRACSQVALALARVDPRGYASRLAPGMVDTPPNV